MTAEAKTNPGVVVGCTVLQDFVSRLLRKAGATEEDAKIVAEALVWADLAQRHPQGVVRLPSFVAKLLAGTIRSPADTNFNSVGPAAEMLDAGDAFGHVAGWKGMRRAVELAKTCGVGVVTVRRSNLNGALSYFCALAAEDGCIGITCTNGFAKVAPHNGVRPVFGTNPIAFGCPTSSGAPILVDFSTSAIAGSTTRSLDAQGLALPDGVALDKHGLPARSQKDLAEGTLLPAAGPKGYGLALMVEILCGVLAGAALSKEVGSVFRPESVANVGQVFLALDIGRFQPMEAFLSRVETLSTWIKESAGENERVRLPGVMRREFAERSLRHGIMLPADSLNAVAQLAEKLDMNLPW